MNSLHVELKVAFEAISLIRERGTIDDDTLSELSVFDIAETPEYKELYMAGGYTPPSLEAYFTVRNAAKTRFLTLITTNDWMNIKKDLSNVVAIVEVNFESGERKVIVHRYDAVYIEKHNSSGYALDLNTLEKDATLMSDEYDDGASGDLVYDFPEDTPIIGGMRNTFNMSIW